MKQSDTITVSVDVTNSGKVAGKEVVQLFLSDEFASLIPAGKSLKGFEKIQLAPGETKTVYFQIKLSDLKFADTEGQWIFEPGTFRVKINKLISNFELN